MRAPEAVGGRLAPRAPVQPAQRARRARKVLRSSPVWVYWVFLLQFACQLILDFVDVGALRVLVRVAAFGVSLVLLAFLPGKGVKHPAAKAAMAVLAIAGISLLHPGTESFLAGAAQIGMYLAILAPLFWAARMEVDEKALRNALLLIWGFHTVSAGVGVLQVYFPGQFMPNLSSVVVSQGAGYVNSLMIETASGERTLRPMGLTDVPGGASMSGFYAFMLGTGILLSVRTWRWRLACIASMLLGITALYLSYVRSVLVLLAITTVAMATVLLIRRRARELATFASVVAVIGLLGFGLATSLGGDGVAKRVNSLLEDAPTEVYQKNRGHFLEQTFEVLLPEYPLGAGLAKWGMMGVYFADKTIADPETIWVEIQWTGWLLDGGLPMILAYACAVLLALWVSFRAAIGKLGRNRSLFLVAVLIFSYDVGALALTFNFPFFVSQAGLEFWIMNALLHSALMRSVEPPRPALAVVPRAPEAAPA